MNSLEGAMKASGSPPSYPKDQPRETDAPPEYRDDTSSQAQALAKIQGPLPPFGRFTEAMGLYGSLISKTFYLCSADKTDRLYAVSAHTGFSMKWPLGPKPGLYLYNGPTNKFPLLAAVGWDTVWSASSLAFSVNSIFLIPHINPEENPKNSLVTETMRAGTATDGSNIAVCFRFSIEAGEKRQRQDFEWRKTKEDYDIDSEVKGGTRYVLTLVSGDASSAGSGSSSKAASLSAAPSPDRHREATAVLTFTKAFTSLTHQFSLQITESLGDRWRLAVVMTALRIWHLRVSGKTNKTTVRAGEMIHRNEAKA